jgi:hypothetical protein
LEELFTDNLEGFFVGVRSACERISVHRWHAGDRADRGVVFIVSVLSPALYVRHRFDEWVQVALSLQRLSEAILGLDVVWLAPGIFRVERFGVVRDRWENVFTKECTIAPRRLLILEYFLIRFEKLSFTQHFFHPKVLLIPLLFQRPRINQSCESCLLHLF